MDDSGYALLALNILFSTSFGQIFKYAIDRQRHVLAVGTINYAFGAAVAAGVAVATGQWKFTLPVLIAGVFGGVAYAAAFLVWRRAIAAAGLGLTVSVARAAVVVPIAMSVVLWGEMPTLSQVVGIVLLLSGFFVMSNRDAVKTSSKQSWGLTPALLLFIFGGFAISTPKVAHELGCDPVRWLYITLQFTSAALVTGTATWLKPLPLTRKDVTIGIALGGVNVVGLFLWTLTLQRLPGVIAFPAFSAGMLVLTTALALTIWRERITRRGYVGIALTAVAMVLVK
jgi:drug/metabolite transporter (DMT)-like permease